ncbi:MAG: protein-L-isoaspartate(D-aspartate) O-methyltransferase [Phycisphaerales bacterium]|nr:protein-L-isoaspartate(D-aspartate) O-methyltransferase [Phycisphaerales bacterium]
MFDGSASTVPDAHDFEAMRRRMVDEQLAARDVRSTAVLDAMQRVPREAFVSADAIAGAFSDNAMPIDCDQTISQPYIVAKMTELLEVSPQSRVLEIGTGCGYQTAVLATLAQFVYSIEFHARLADAARERLRRLGYFNVAIRCGDGTLGWPDQAPFDRIILTAGPPEVPPALLDQLADGGILVAPVGPLEDQTLIRMRRVGNSYPTEQVMSVRFVPMVGAEGWGGAAARGGSLEH